MLSMPAILFVKVQFDFRMAQQKIDGFDLAPEFLILMLPPVGAGAFSLL